MRMPIVPLNLKPGPHSVVIKVEVARAAEPRRPTG
jgi:hypothetical protein